MEYEEICEVLSQFGNPGCDSLDAVCNKCGKSFCRHNYLECPEEKESEDIKGKLYSDRIESFKTWANDEAGWFHIRDVMDSDNGVDCLCQIWETPSGKEKKAYIEDGVLKVKDY